MPLVEVFAANLKKLRIKHQWSQETLADRANLSVSYISMLERDQRSPPLHTLEVLAAVFGIPAVQLLKG